MNKKPDLNKEPDNISELGKIIKKEITFSSKEKVKGKHLTMVCMLADDSANERGVTKGFFGGRMRSNELDQMKELTQYVFSTIYTKIK